MKQIGIKIREARKMKGLTQEGLAEKAGINVRTLQRIENDHVNPRGQTFQLIGQALDLDVEELLSFDESEDQTYLVYFHLSVLAFLVMPLGNIILPLVLWLNQRNRVSGLKHIGAQLLNYQILWTIIVHTLWIGYAVLKILHFESATLVIIALGLLYTGNIVLAVWSAIRVKKSGINQGVYPVLIKFIK